MAAFKRTGTCESQQSQIKAALPDDRTEDLASAFQCAGCLGKGLSELETMDGAGERLVLLGSRNDAAVRLKEGLLLSGRPAVTIAWPGMMVTLYEPGSAAKRRVSLASGKDPFLKS
jgi:hypothetical protein